MAVSPLELWLVRHGETTRSRDGRLAGWANVHLTAHGREEATAVRELLAGEAFDGVWCSDLTRARTTARLAWGAATPDRRLREIDFGRLEGHPWERLEPALKDALMNFDGFHAPGGESLADLRGRALDFLTSLPVGRHLLFTHGGVIRLLTRETGEDGFVPTGTVVGLDWPRRRLLFLRRLPGKDPASGAAAR